VQRLRGPDGGGGSLKGVGVDPMLVEARRGLGGVEERTGNFGSLSASSPNPLVRV
jgi:hypothetical protein